MTRDYTRVNNLRNKILDLSDEDLRALYEYLSIAFRLQSGLTAKELNPNLLSYREGMRFMAGHILIIKHVILEQQKAEKKQQSKVSDKEDKGRG